MIFAIRPTRLALPIVCAITLFTEGCATAPSPIQKAESSIFAGHYEEGLSALESLAKNENDSKAAHVALVRDRSLVAERISFEAKTAINGDRFDDADALYTRLLAIDSNNAQVKLAQQRLHDLRIRNNQLLKADELFRSGDLEGAEHKLQSIILEEPENRKALELMRKITDRQIKSAPLTPVLGPEFKKTISLEFKDAALKDIFDAIWHASGINFILDRDVRNDIKASIYVRDVSIEDAIEALLMGQQLTKKIVSAKTLFIYPKTPQKISEYQDLTVRNFFLAYADAKQIQNMLKTILKTKDVFIDEKRNLLVVRDSQESVDLAEKLIRAHDQPEPEVMLALDVIEITRSKLKEVGITFPTQIGIGVSNPISLDALRKLNSTGINIGSSTTTGGILGMNITDTNSDTNLLANPRIRVRNREKAKIHIGDRLPVLNTTSTPAASGLSNTILSTNVTYLDVGLKLEVEPQVLLDNDVVVKLNLEVSTASPDKLNSQQYDVGTRNTNTVLTIHDGETQVLAGLIQDDERNSGSRLPGLADIPLLGRLFSDEHKGRDKTEIILAITPHIINNLIRPSADLTEYSSGTESGQRGGIGMGMTPTSIPVSPAVQTQTPFSGGGGFSSHVPNLSPVSGFNAAQDQNSAPVANTAPAANTAANPAANPVATPAANSAPPATGVIPMTDFAPPPGVGSPSGGH